MTLRLMVGTLALLVFAAGCTGMEAVRGSQETDEVYFLSNKQPSSGGDAALLEGILELSDGCLLIKGDGDSKRFSPVWPYEFSYKRVADNVEIIDGSGEVVVRVGERVGVGGSGFGPVAYSDLDKYVSGNLSCPKPFWGVVGVVRVP